MEETQSTLLVGVMDSYEQIEDMVAHKYGASTTTRKSIGDFMIGDNHAVNVKSNNVDKANYSPNMISIKRMFKWMYEEGNELSFVFVDYRFEDGDLISIDIPNRTLTLHVKDEIIKKRRTEWHPPEPKIKRGYLSLYARLAESADKGAIIPHKS